MTMTLTLARKQLHDAISALCDPLWHEGHPLDSRYQQLRGAIGTPGCSGHGRHTDASEIIPAQIDCLKLVILIDNRTAILTRGARITSTVGRLQHLTTRKFRPQDVELLEAMTTEIQSWAKAIDDLFAPKPIYLNGHCCPRCRHSHAYRWSDDGDRIRTPALAVTPEKAVCQNCHDVWPASDFMFLGRLLGHTPEGVAA